MFVRLLVLWIYLVATSLHMVGVFATSLNGCRETPAQVRVLSAEVDLRFEYDALGRRVAKINEYGKAENHKITRFLWDGNVPLHEWSYPFSERPETVDSSEGKRSYASPEPQTELTTWIFDEGTFVPSAKLVGERRYSIISDYLGTPIEAYDEEGKRVWVRVLDIYGRTRSEVGESGFIPFLYQGQYLDRETGLAYNRFRYYSPETGAYISQDPIRLEAGLTNLYAYVHDVNAWVDPLGLIIVFRGERSKNSPDKIFKEGFRPKGKHTNLLMHTQSNTTPGDFISSSKSVDIAKGFASKNGYIYVIYTNNGIDVNDVLGVESLYPKQLEVSIRGYIPSEDIVGVYPVVKGKVGDQMIENPNYKGSSSNHINSTTH